ncbi:RmlC-like cupin domain-containing protein [Talaromyces proteolyticus]|uniref:RmlC-like cupin domain-containing protein n=1 Tax=Talaromyces proteolyticus TaxID=1131652 RepID=A0AAD4KJ22_9EURO|nr:RmlC-like cupin domain-containing protein [Talaromyces proteolyticus]KAH8692184.1 RmlC-like cupin domain-containing protein [Talaromyces proteolyticus]
MGQSKQSPVRPVILHANNLQNTPAESFNDTSRGDVTWHTLFSRPRTPTSDLSAGLAVCPPRTGHLCRHRHSQAEIYYIIEGSGHVLIDGETYRVSKGSTVFIPSDAEHGVINSGQQPLKWFYVFPTDSFEDIVYRFSKDKDPKAKL